MYIFMDLETYSECDIKRGAYAYAEHPTTEVLLWGYAIDDAPAKVWDVTKGEAMPHDLHEALGEVMAGEAKTVWHNGFNFDTNVLAQSRDRRTRIRIPRSAIIDTMHIAYQHGLPGALGDLCTIYGLGEDKAKDRDGKRLVQLFCKPHRYGKNDPTKIRYNRISRPEDWERFVNYCRLDVEAERELFKRLPRINLTRQERALELLDDRINQRGMLMDIDLARAAIQALGDEAKANRSRTAELTGGALDSTTRTAALIAYLKDRFGIELKNLQKNEVARLIEDDSIPEPMRDLLRIRLTSAKASVKKYQAILDCVNSDGRLRGCLQFRGASRTGRWCLTGDHEVLTPNGWVPLCAWQGGKIAVWNPQSEALSFQPAEALAFFYEGKMYHYESARCDQLSTPDHKMPYLGKDGRWTSDTVENLANKRIAIPFTGIRHAPATLEHDLLRVVIMTQADGCYTTDGQLNFRFKKERKVQRCKMLLRRAGIPFTFDRLSGGVTRINVRSRDLPLWLRIFRDKQFGYWLLNESADVIFDELPEWDGYRGGPNSIQYSTNNRANADLIQALAALSGRYATLLLKKVQKENWAPQYVVNIWNTPGKSHTLPKPTVEDFSGTVYCASTSTGFFLVRRGGKVWVTGNSGRLFQPQNLPRQTKDPDDVNQDIDDLKAGELWMWSQDLAGDLAQALRGAIIVPPGKKMVVADYSNIEGRVLAWVAGEKWKLQAFREYDACTGPDLYKLTYSRAFNIDVAKVTKPQRQMGKVLELAMGYGGGVGAFVAFATGYSVHLETMADSLDGVIPSDVYEESCDLYEWAAGQNRLGGLSRKVWIACDSVKRLWRRSNPHIVALWDSAAAACVTAIREPGVKVGIALDGAVHAVRKGSWLYIRLPSGRFLCYPSARLGSKEEGCDLTYMGVNQYTRKWERIKTFAGKLVENTIQAIACDVLADALPRLDANGYEPILTVHDEVLAEALDTNEFTHERMEKLMATNPKWAKGLPLAAAGFESKRYHK